MLEMTWTERQRLIFSVKFSLSRGLKSVRGFPRQLHDSDLDRIAEAIVSHIERSNFRIVAGEPTLVRTTDEYPGYS